MQDESVINIFLIILLFSTGSREVMPKKFKGENTKAVVARQRKADARHEKEERLAKEKEDEYWRDDDKHVTRKQQRKVIISRIWRINLM